MQHYIPQIVYAGWCLFWAYANKVQIINNDRVYHGVNGVFHLATCIYFSLKIHWIIGLAILFEGRLFFDIPLNLFRKLPIGYVPENPKSLVDKVERGVFGNNGFLPKIIYLLILAFLLILQHKII